MATISFNTTFDLTTTNPEFVFLDTTNWAGQGISTSDVNGVFKIVSPSGITIYNNVDYSNSGCDIRTALSLTSQQTISLPLTGTLLVEPGTYTITYSQYNSNLNVYYTQINTYTYEYVAPEICISQVADCISPQFVSTDLTEYEVEGITPTKTLTHTIYYPNGSAGQGSPLVGSSAVLSTGVFYNGTQTTEIEASLSYTFSDGLIVLDEIDGSKDILVNCEYICSIYCCIKALEQRVISNQGVNQLLYNQYSNTFQQVMAFVGLAQLAISCGKSSDVNCYLDEIASLTECTEDCSCDGDDPSRVSGLGGLINEVVVNSGGTPVIVTPVVVGNVTTYSITLNSSFINKVNSSYNSVVAAGVNVTSVGTVTVGDTITYTVNVEDAAVAAGANISVSSNFVSPTTTYTVSGNVSTTKDWEVSGDTISGNPTTFSLTGLSVTVPATGKYLILFDAMGTVSTSGLAAYKFRINSTDLTTDTKAISFIDVASPPYQNMTLTAIENLTINDVITIRLIGVPIPDMVVEAKALKLIRLS